MSQFRGFLRTKIADAVAANGTGAGVQISDFRHLIADIATASLGVGGTLTVRFKGSISELTPNFSTAASPSNLWSYIELIDTSNGAIIDGDVGVTVAGANDVVKVELNVNGLDWVAVEVSGYSGPGSATVLLKGFENG